MNKQLKTHFFWKHVLNSTTIFKTQKTVLYKDILRLLKYAYAALFIMVFIQFGQIDALANSKLVDVLWPVWFINQQNLIFVVYFLSANLLFGLVLVQFKNSQILRIYVFIVYFLLAALSNSFGKINHSLHLVLIPLFCFALIPNRSAKQSMEKTILMFLSAKFFLLLAYSLTGFWKIFWGIIECFTQEVSMFSPLSFRNILIFQFESSETTILGNWFLEHYVIGWLLFLGVVYLEFASIAIFFKPNLYKIWGVALICMHIGLQLVLNVNMYVACFSIIILLILSPFQQQINGIQLIKNLPVLDLIFFRRKK